jgi:hypothetical protein
MYTSRIKTVLDQLLSSESFVSWTLLAISILSLPTYIIARSYGIIYEQQIAEIFILMLCCVISIFVGLSIYGMIGERGVYTIEYKAIDTVHPLDRTVYSANAIREFELYLRKINTLNDNRYTAKDGSTRNIAYCRSSDHVYGDM